MIATSVPVPSGYVQTSSPELRTTQGKIFLPGFPEGQNGGFSISSPAEMDVPMVIEKCWFKEKPDGEDGEEFTFESARIHESSIPMLVEMFRAFLTVECRQWR